MTCLFTLIDRFLSIRYETPFLIVNNKASQQTMWAGCKKPSVVGVIWGIGIDYFFFLLCSDDEIILYLWLINYENSKKVPINQPGFLIYFNIAFFHGLDPCRAARSLRMLLTLSSLLVFFSAPWRRDTVGSRGDVLGRFMESPTNHPCR